MRDLASIVGEDALTERDKLFLAFADEFERRFVAQGKDEDRSIEETLDIGWQLLSMLPKSELKKIEPKYIERYLPKKA